MILRFRTFCIFFSFKKERKEKYFSCGPGSSPPVCRYANIFFIFLLYTSSLTPYCYSVYIYTQAIMKQTGWLYVVGSNYIQPAGEKIAAIMKYANYVEKSKSFIYHCENFSYTISQLEPFLLKCHQYAKWKQIHPPRDKHFLQTF